MEKSKTEKSSSEKIGKRIISDDENGSGPSTKIMKSCERPAFFIRVNSNYRNDDFIENFRKSWDNEVELMSDDKNVQFFSKPFKMCAIQNFIEDTTVIKHLVEDMLKVNWSRKQMDLYELYQSVDLASIELPALQQFMENLKTNVMPWMEKLSGIKLKHVSASCSMYNCGDYLLLHDDLVSDRQIAFVYYISPWFGVERWTDDMGGSLELFETDENGYPNFPITRRFNPRNNQLVFFKVGAKSFHQVAEVTSLDHPRLTINGWFHGDENAESSRVLPVNVVDDFVIATNVQCALEEFVNKDYLCDEVKASIQTQIEDESEISLSDFLLPEIYEKVSSDLVALDSSCWTVKKPANGQFYEILKLTELTGSLRDFIDIFKSKAIFQLLHEYTDLDLAGALAVEPKMTVEIQRWNRGCYTILTDSSSNSKSMLDVIFYVNAAENVGVVNYVAQDVEDDPNEGISYGEENNYKDSNPVLLTLTPRNNTLNLIYRNEGTSRFTKYVSKKNIVNHDVFIIVCSYIEITWLVELTRFRKQCYFLAYKWQIYASLAFIFVVIGIGVPMWWKTTEVYRVGLPYSAIRNLKSNTMRIKSRIGIFTFEKDRSGLLVKELRERFATDEYFDIDFVEITDVDGAANAKTPVGLETMILKEFTMRPGDFLFFEWSKLKDDILLTTERTALINKETTSSQIAILLRGSLLQTGKINALITGDERLGHQTTPPHPKADVLISVINPRPDSLDIKWNVKVATEMYLAPYLEHLKNLSDYTLKTQWRYQVPFEFQPKQIRDTSLLGRHYSITEDSLPHLITTIEKNLGGGIADNPSINLVLYVPPCEISPLYIYTKSGEKASHNNIDAFISEKWGSVLIYNPPMELCKKSNEDGLKISFEVNSRDVMQIFLAHLMILTETTVKVNVPGVKITEMSEIAPSTWEYDSYVRVSCIKYLTTTIHTLQSLIKLLGDISYIVINDEVGRAINDAYETVIIAEEHLRRNDLLLATEYAKKAFIASEQAFFDASLLAQLYFPDEQKYAIYIPLFLPIMVPVISSLAMIKKYFLNKKQPKLKTN